MKTQALFDNIAERIGEELRQAEQSIYLAVAWLTNHQLFDILVEKAKQGITVQLLCSNDKINRNNSIVFDRLQMGNSAAYLIGDGERNLMHNKFCVIDSRVVITGSITGATKQRKTTKILSLPVMTSNCATNLLPNLSKFVMRMCIIKRALISHWRKLLSG